MKTPILVLAALSAALARADEAPPLPARSSLDLAVQRDGQHGQSAAASVRLPVAAGAWVQAGAGQSRRRDADSGLTYRPVQAALGAGVAGGRWQAGVNASQRRDGRALRQTDVAVTAEWKPTDAITVGVDAAHRRGRASVAAGGGGASPVEQRLRGRGAGVHGAVALTPRLSVYAATMRSHYTVSTTQAGADDGLLAGLPLLPRRVSAVNRDEAALDRSHQLGATWRVNDRVALNGEAMKDRLHDGGSLSSLQLKAAIAAGAGWTVTPGIGRSRGPQGSTNYGLLGASYAW